MMMIMTAHRLNAFPHFDASFQNRTVVQDLETDPLRGRCTNYNRKLFHPNEQGPPSCFGLISKRICNFATNDLSRMWEENKRRRCFTANKLNLDVDPVAVVCQSKALVNSSLLRNVGAQRLHLPQRSIMGR